MSPSPPAARTFGDRFELLTPLHTRDTTGVFLAHDHALDERCALKLLDAEELPEQAALRFLAEARVLEAIRHRHVVSGRGHGEDHGLLWYAMDHVPRGNLQDFVKLMPVPTAHALALTFQVLLGLDAIHRAGIIHRDIKLTNVMLNADYHACVTDLGVAHHPPETVNWRTLAGQDLGTPGYRAPEQVYDPAGTDARADLFSAGVLLYRLITRKQPQRLQLAHSRPDLIGELAPAIQAITLRATKQDPLARYATAADMADAVADAHDTVTALHDAGHWRAQLERCGDPDPWRPLQEWLRGDA